MHHLRPLLAAIACALVCLTPVSALNSTPLASEFLVKAQAFIPGLYAVSPELVRGAQPRPGGLKLLKEAGIKTVFNLTENSVQEEKEARELGLNYINIPTSHFKPLPKETINQFLSAVSSEATAPVFIHCKEGVDRTGALVAIYRIDHEKWTVSKSYKEMISHGFHPFFTQLTKSVYGYAAKDGKADPIPSPWLGSLANPFKRYTGSPIPPAAERTLATDPEQL